jgi:uncharacterized membrane protein
MLIALWTRVYRAENNPGAVVIPPGIILSAVVVALILVTGWLGSAIVLRHRIGIIDSTSARD